MSATPPSTPATDASAGCFSQSARWRFPPGGPDPPVSAAAARGIDQADGAGASPVVAVARLHRHALESVFAFLDLRELVFALQVSRGWLGAVQSMRRLDLTLIQPTSPLIAVARSVLSRHVAVLGCQSDKVTLGVADLSALANRMGHLRSLSCRLALPSPDRPLVFPAALRRLHSHFTGLADGDAAQVNSAIAVIAQLPLLEELTIRLPAISPQFSLAPLAALPLLRRLGVDWPLSEARLSDTQIDQLRALPQLLSLSVTHMSISVLQRLLRPPHDLQWQKLSLPFSLNEAITALLPLLPSLTAIDGAAVCGHFGWLRGLPNLTDVGLRFYGQEFASGRAHDQSLVAALQSCTNIERLKLHGFADLTTVQLADLLPRLPRLRELDLRSLDIDSLAFLSQPPLTSRLTSLQLWSCRNLPPVELRHVHALRGLRQLELKYSFTAPLSDHDRTRFAQLESFAS